MRHVLTLIVDPERAALQDSIVDAARSALGALGARVAPPDWLARDTACDLVFTPPDPEPFDPRRAEAAVRQVVADAAVDVVAQGCQGRRKRLLIADMDSTVIENEMFDEIAAQAGLLDEIAPLTARANAGEIDHAAALRRRVAFLEGLPASLIDHVREAIRITAGAAALIATMRANGAHTVLASSGLVAFTSYVRDLLGFHEHAGNDVEIDGGRFTGHLRPPVLDGEAKADLLRGIARSQGMALQETLAVGDGANDMPMIAVAGLGVAFRAKRKVREAAAARIDHGDLTALLYLQGYRAEDVIG